MPTKNEYETCKRLADMIEKSILDFPAEINHLTKKEAEEITRVLKQESKRSFFYQCEIRVVTCPPNFIEEYKLVVSRK